MDPTMEALYDSGVFGVLDALSDTEPEERNPGGELFGSSFSPFSSPPTYPIQTPITAENAPCERRQFLEALFQRPQWQGLPDREQGEAYLLHQYRRNRSLSTMRSNYRMIVRFSDFLTLKGKSGLQELSSRDVESFVEHEQDRGLKASTVKTDLEVLKGFLRYLVEKEVLDRGVLPWKLKISVPQSLPRAMDPDDVRALIAVRGSVRDRAMVMLLLRTGMRIGELLGVRVIDVNMAEQKILVHEAEKNLTGRVVYFSDDAKEALAAWIIERDPSKEMLFYGKGSNTMSYTTARTIFVKYLQAAGLSHKNYTLHSLRHTYATDLINAGAPLECVGKLLGHANLDVTRRYARLSDKTREEEYFKAMAIIERGHSHVDEQRDHQLQALLEETQPLSEHGEELHEHP